MKRWITHFVIAGYLMVLCYGFVAHAFKVNPYGSMANYFFVWDMYCGWNSFEKRTHLVAQGESGQYYDVTPPWKELQPYGSAKRHDYDSWGFYSGQIAANTLRHTQHEPIREVFLVEQLWSKKYNLPDELWSQRFDGPKEPKSYYYIRSVFSPEGETLKQHFDWETNLAFHSIMDNQSLRSTVARAQPYLGSDQIYRPTTSSIQQASFETTTSTDR